ncbi:nitroreductase [Pseudonocardia sp. CNS-004]|nr:nitroreductase [Pseudonocardia sp. CNS-004]
MADRFDGEYAPSPTAWVREAVERFEASGGADALNEPGGAPIIVISNVGVRTGKIRKTPIMRIEEDGTYLGVASNGGLAENPAWVDNIRAHPRVQLQDGPVSRTCVARELDGEERRVCWEHALAVWPTYGDYQRMTDRRIPLFLFEPVD